MKKVLKWITYKELEDTTEQVQTLAGTWVDRPLYKEADFDDEYEDAIIKDIVDNDYVICGDTHQYLCIPVFENNFYVMLSMRRWGELMATAAHLSGGYDYDYMDFYIASVCDYDENYPGQVKEEENEE